jgi:hypothetical protein
MEAAAATGGLLPATPSVEERLTRLENALLELNHRSELSEAAADVYARLEERDREVFAWMTTAGQTEYVMASVPERRQLLEEARAARADQRAYEKLEEGIASGIAEDFRRARWEPLTARDWGTIADFLYTQYSRAQRKAERRV